MHPFPGAQEFGDGGDDHLPLVFAQFGKDGQGEDLTGGALGLGKAAFGIGAQYL